VSTVPISVLIVDDQELVRTGFRMVISSQSDMIVVAEAADGRQAIAEAARVRPDVVLMDIRMPGIDGIEATRAVRAANARIKVVILTTFDADEYVYEALAAGASGFLLKDGPADELYRAIRVAHAGES